MKETPPPTVDTSPAVALRSAEEFLLQRELSTVVGNRRISQHGGAEVEAHRARIIWKAARQGRSRDTSLFLNALTTPRQVFPVFVANQVRFGNRPRRILPES